MMVVCTTVWRGFRCTSLGSRLLGLLELDGGRVEGNRTANEETRWLSSRRKLECSEMGEVECDLVLECRDVHRQRR